MSEATRHDQDKQAACKHNVLIERSRSEYLRDQTVANPNPSWYQIVRYACDLCGASIIRRQYEVP